MQAPALATTCISTLTAELTEGPYYLDDILFRSDIKEGESGIPVTLNVYLLDTDCNPVVDAFISIWHANASGIYSGFTGEHQRCCHALDAFDSRTTCQLTVTGVLSISNRTISPKAGTSGHGL